MPNITTPENPHPAASPARKRKPAVEVRPVEEPAPDPALIAKVEAVILSSDRPVSAGKVARAVGLVPASEEHADQEPDSAFVRAGARAVEAAVTQLNEQYAATSRSFRIEAVAGGFKFMTLPEHAAMLAAFHNAAKAAKLSRSAVETLAVIAYKQPVTRAELESVRGVSCGEVLKTLLERRLVTIKGRAEELGRPMLYGTTTQFLDHFGLASVKDLPTPEEFKAFSQTASAAANQA
jgi:segregation and condensation protein B